jgi:ribosomal-protein-alanine N-acetyltransferase
MIIHLPIQTSSLVLRQFVPEDSARVFIMSQEPGMGKWIPDQVYDDEQTALKVLNDLIAYYHDPGNPLYAPYVLGICLTQNKELIGHVGLSPLNKQVEIGYAIAHQFQGRGYASQAVAAMVEWGMSYFGLSGILGIALKDNIPSCKVLETAGFALVEETMGQLHGSQGIVRKYIRVNLH